MDDTFAGQHACNAEDHTRPFIIEWDATDMSSFESYASNDIVFVKYEGCKLRVLDECRDDDVHGAKGAYKPPEWTSGSLETIDIHNSGELYAKLPLGEATLGGRVNSGEQFHMEYFVAGTTTATRSAVYRDDIKSNPGCDSATHFVYAYNLGAFALGSVNEFNTEVGGSLFGFGAGSKTSKGRKADKKGGDLAVCRAEEATEVLGCKTPIRINLRKIRDGKNPKEEKIAAPDTSDTMSAAALVNAKVEMSSEARSHYDAAMQKLTAKDGPGCLKELDAHDELDPTHKSTAPKSQLAMFRAQCVMIAGQCNAGKKLARMSYENTPNMKQFGPEHTDRAVEALAMMHCQGASMSKRDQMMQALMRLQQAATITKKSVKFCDNIHAKIKKLAPLVKPKDDDDTRLMDLNRTLFAILPMCYQRAGNCKKAFKVYKENLPAQSREGYDRMKDPKVREQSMRSAFESMIRKCKGK
jgi:hypothetical protein